MVVLYVIIGVLAYLLILSWAAIIINGLDERWRKDQFLSVFLFIFFMPIVLPMVIKACREDSSIEVDDTGPSKNL